jgi:hypothetical protein
MSRYTINDIEYPSVTEVLDQLKKEALIQWAVNCAIKYIEQNGLIQETLEKAKTEYRNVSQKSLDIGSEVHSSIESYIKFGRDKLGKIKPEVENALIAFWDWEKENNVDWIESEMTVVNKDLGYAGTLDAIANVNGKIVCIDFKSSKDIYPEYITQVCAYKLARESMDSPIKIDYVGILRLDKETGIPEFKLIDKQERIEREQKAFEALLKYYYLAKKRRLKNNKKAM